LRRLAEGIRKQDWFIVVLEILIVVFGIFAGLQVDDWNRARLERVEKYEDGRDILLEDLAKSIEHELSQ
jgi:hypothetical protein